MVATAQRYQELHPDVEVVWEKRSLKDFEEYPIQKLAAEYDLMVIDHPFIGYGARHKVFLPLDELLTSDFLANQAANSIGGSHASYHWEGHQWALAIDAATPVAAWRPDLLAQLDLAVPATWSDVLALARDGHVEVPAAPINCLMDFYGLCLAAGATPFAHPNCVVERSAGLQAIAWLHELVSLCHRDCLERNPIQSLDRLAATDNTRVAYCLFPYGYSNYSQDGYASHVLHFGDLPVISGTGPMTTTLGGTGLALSAQTAHPALAAAYACFIAHPETQRTLYTRAGGQPGHRLAWLDPENNRRSHDYFRATLPALDRAFVRPRHPGYLHHFQAPAGSVMHRYLKRVLSGSEALSELDRLWVAAQTA